MRTFGLNRQRKWKSSSDILSLLRQAITFTWTKTDLSPAYQNAVENVGCKISLCMGLITSLIISTGRVLSFVVVPRFFTITIIRNGNWWVCFVSITVGQWGFSYLWIISEASIVLLEVKLSNCHNTVRFRPPL